MSACTEIQDPSELSKVINVFPILLSTDIVFQIQHYSLTSDNENYKHPDYFAFDVSDNYSAFLYLFQ